MTIYFAWVDSTETTFGVQHHVVDEDVFSFDLAHEEGQMPTLEVTIINPRVGLLNANRNQWCWLSYFDGATTTALFFGRLLGIPSNLFEETVKLTFISRSNEHIALKQTLADSLAVRPYWEPLFLDDKSRRDPDAIIEGRAAAYHVDRLSLAWTISDILTGEDGTVTFTEDDVIYETVNVDIRDTPLKAVRVRASVNWTQCFQPGSLFVGAWTISTYTGGSLIQAWPKPGASIGGGWICAPGSGAKDLGGVEHAESVSDSGSFSDRNHEHMVGDCISGSWSASTPRLPYGGLTINQQNTADFGTIGDMGGDTGKGFGDGIISGAPQGSNIDDTSCSTRSTWQTVALWKVATSLFLTYDPSESPFTENAALTVTADLQNVLADADTQEETEVIELTGSDVGEPLVDYRVRSSLDSTAVAVGQLILPNEPSAPGGTSFQICTTAGTTASSPPQYSDDVGVSTTDGGAVFTCVGGSLPSVGAWNSTSYFRKGSLIVDSRPGGAFHVCISAGYTGDTVPSFGATTGDGSVTWQSLGTGGPSISIPVGGTPGAITAYGYFPQARGLWSVEYMIAIARAKILTRARCIEISWDAPFSKGLALSCRKNATIQDSRLPGGVATGKIISYHLIADGDTGEFKTTVRIGCAVGTGGSVAASAGTPTYISSDYIGSDYQQFTGQVSLVASSVGYTPPAPDGNYSGYNYPITLDQVLIGAGWTGNITNQKMAIMRGFGQQARGGQESISSITQATTIINNSLLAGKNGIAAANAAVNSVLGSIYFTLQIRPIGGVFNETPYYIDTTPLIVPQQIDLGADSVS